MNVDNSNNIEHPIFNNSEFFIETPMVKSLLTEIKMCLGSGISGAAILGSYRTGKTRALNYVNKELINCSGEQIPSRFISVAPRDVGTIAGVFKNICHSLEIPLKYRATADDMSNIILHHLGELSLTNSTRHVVLIVDELQRLNIRQFEAFAELYDGLSIVGSNLFVLFAGNDSDSNSLIKNINRKSNELIYGRFFTKKFHFYGIRTFEECKKCLQQYDICKFPANGKSYTQYFLRGLVPKDWRLDSLADLIWSEYREHFEDPLNYYSWPMQYFVSMVRVLLTDFLPTYGVDDEDQLKLMIQESINVSGLVKSQVRKVG